MNQQRCTARAAACLRHILVDQLHHLRIARTACGATHDDSDDLTAITFHGGDQIEAGGVDVAGLDAAHARNCAQKAVVVAVGAALVGEGTGLEQLEMLRETVLNGAPKGCHVARGGALTGIRQAMRVLEGGLAHADLAGRTGHAVGKAGFGAADILGDDGGHVVGRLGHQRQDRILDLNRGARPQAKL